MWGMRNGFVMLCVAVIVVVAGAWALLHQDPPPSIGADLPDTFVDANRVFAERVRAAFPLGSSVAAMRSELERQGFALDETLGSGWDGSAQVVHENLLCSEVWYIQWQVKNGGRLRGIDGSYGGQCIWDPGPPG